MSPCMSMDVQWRDRKRYYGLPLSFEVYMISSDRLSLSCGFLRQDSRDILLYRIRDISLSRSLSQIVFGVGTVSVRTMDNEIVRLENIRAPHQVKELLYLNSEEQKRARRYRYREYYRWDADDHRWPEDWP